MKDVQILTNDQVLQLLSVEECIPVIENLFCCLENCQMPPKMYLDIPNGDFRAMPAIVNNTAGIKWCGVHSGQICFSIWWNKKTKVVN